MSTTRVTINGESFMAAGHSNELQQRFRRALSEKTLFQFGTTDGAGSRQVSVWPFAVATFIVEDVAEPTRRVERPRHGAVIDDLGPGARANAVGAPTDDL